MPMTFEILENRFPELAALLPLAMRATTDHAAQTLYTTAVDTCPVDTGDMQASHLIEKPDDDHWEVSVQKETAASGGKTYALFVNGGTIHMAAQPWLTDASVKAEQELESLSALVGFV